MYLATGGLPEVRLGPIPQINLVVDDDAVADLGVGWPSALYPQLVQVRRADAEGSGGGLCSEFLKHDRAPRGAEMQIS